jgi:hypothetical protein
MIKIKRNPLTVMKNKQYFNRKIKKIIIEGNHPPKYQKLYHIYCLFLNYLTQIGIWCLLWHKKGWGGYENVSKVVENNCPVTDIETLLIWFCRYLVASRDIEPGEIIFADAPFAVGLSSTPNLHCITCFKKVFAGCLLVQNNIKKLNHPDVS